MLKIINKLYDKKISSSGLSAFRVLFSLVLFFEINRIYRYKELYFDPLPFLKPSSIDVGFPLLVWMIVLFLLIIGFYTRFMTILNYLFVLIFITSMGAFEYHMDYVYTGISFLMIFIPLSQSFSIDNLLEKFKYSSTRIIHRPKKEISVLYYYVLLFVGVVLFYVGSVMFKVKSDLWIRGLGMWLPSSLPHVVIYNHEWLLNQEYLIKFLGYLTFLFEIVFPFTFFIKKFRTTLMLVGLCLHIGILIVFPIPYFALGVVALYMLLIPVAFWGIVSNKLKSKTTSLEFFYDAECPLCIRTIITIEHFDVFNKISFKNVQAYGFDRKEFKDMSEEELLDNIYSIDKKGKIRQGVDTYKKVFMLIPLFYPLGLLLKLPLISYIAKSFYNYIASNRRVERCTEDACGFTVPIVKNEVDKIKLLNNLRIRDLRVQAWRFLIVVILIFQFNVMFNFPLSSFIIEPLTKEYKILKIPLAKLNEYKVNLGNVSQKFLGITPHGVFVDGHFRGYDKVFTVMYKGEYLPMFNKSGMPEKYLQGGSWANFLFRVNRPYVMSNLDHLKKGLIRYVAFWAHKNKVYLSDAEFKIVVREVRAPFEWEPDLLKNNLKQPWIEVGTMVWKNNKAEVNLNVNK